MVYGTTITKIKKYFQKRFHIGLFQDKMYKFHKGLFQDKMQKPSETSLSINCKKSC